MNRPFNRLLLIDDEPGIRRLMSLDLSADGYQVSTAEDGLSGVATFARERPDIVLTDLKMPGMDGIEVLKRIKQMSPHTEVIVITGHGDLELAIQSLQLDAGDFITKPVHDQALSVALARARERLQLREQLRCHTEDLERRVAEAAAKVVASERLAAVGQTVATLVHSLKNMLSGLKGGTYLVRLGLDTAQKEQSQQGLEMLDRNIGRVGRLVRDLLTLSKPRRPELEQVELGQLCDEAAEMMRTEAQTRGVELSCPAPAAPLTVRLDRGAMLDALLNLIGNAVDAAAEVSQGQARVSARQQGEEVCLEVSDNGPGLDEEAAGRIFQGFYSSKGAAGTGLGLMVCHKIAVEHGGRVEFASAPGQGTVFRMLLPRRIEGGHDNAPDDDSQPPARRVATAPGQDKGEESS
jgi:signal transduction histidine kinase